MGLEEERTSFERSGRRKLGVVIQVGGGGGGGGERKESEADKDGKKWVDSRDG